MNQAFEAVLAEYEARAAEEHAVHHEQLLKGGVPNRDALLLHVGEDVAKLLRALIEGLGARTILELGASYGYSTLWLAAAAEATGGRVISLEMHDYKLDYAKQMIGRAGLADRVEFIAGDALEVLPTLDGPFDFVLIDLWKDLYIPCLELCLPKLSAGAVVIADNMLSPHINRPEALAYRAFARAQPGMSSVLLPLGQGVEISRVRGPDDVGLNLPS